MSFLEQCSKDIFQAISQRCLLPDIFTLRKCSRNIKHKVDKLLIDRYAIPSKIPQIVNSLIPSNCYYDKDNKYVVCCKIISASYKCMVCKYNFCDNSGQGRCVSSNFKYLRSSVLNKFTQHNVCKECTKNTECPICKKNLNNTGDWCICNKCNKLYCNKQECIGFHNPMKDVYSGTHRVEHKFQNILQLECSECRSNCICCGKQSDGVKCKYCKQFLCDNCKIVSVKKGYFIDFNQMYFCKPCAQTRL